MPPAFVLIINTTLDKTLKKIYNYTHGGYIGGDEMAENCCMERTKKRTEDEYKKLVNRLSRIEGQIRGIRKMLENDAYCTDILIQIAAANAALGAFRNELLAEHIRTCVANDIKNDRNETVEELISTLNALMK